MRKVILVLVAIAFSTSNLFAATIVPSNADIRLDESTTSRNVTFTLDEQIEKLDGKEGFIKAKIKLDKAAKKLIKLDSPKGKVYIPYTAEDNVQTSLPVEFSLKDTTADISTASDLQYRVIFSKKQRKKFGLENFTSNINIDVIDSESEDAGVSVHGFVQLPDISGDDSSSDGGKKSRVIPFSEGSSEAEGATVKVFGVMPDGSLDNAGEPVAEGVVDEKGEFDIQLPPPSGDDEFKPGPELVVEIDGLEDGSSKMHSFIDEETMVVDPRSEFVFEKITEGFGDDSLQQENLGATEIKDFHERIDEMQQNDELTIDGTVTKLDENVGPLVENIIPALNDEETEPEKFDYTDFDIKDFNPDDAVFTNPDLIIPDELLNAQGVAGAYNVAFYYGIVGAELQSIVAQYGNAILSNPSETGVIDATPQFRLRSEAAFVNQANFGGPAEEGDEGDDKGDKPEDPPEGDGGTPDPCYELTAVTDRPTGGDGFEGGKDGEGEGGGLFFTVDSLGVISVIESESVESVAPDEVFKFTSTVTDFLPVGEGMYLGTNIKTGGNFNATDDTYNFGLEHNTGYAIMVKKSDITVDDLATQYGMVGFSSLYEEGGNLTLTTKFGYLNRTGSDVDFSFSTVLLNRAAPVDKNACSSMVVSSSTGTEEGAAAIELDSQGTIYIAGAKDLSLSKFNRKNFFEGYVRPDAGILTFLSYEDVASDGKILFPSDEARKFEDVSLGDRTIHFGVELADSLPSVSGTNYEMHSYEVTLSEDGTVRIETPVSGSRNTLAFGSGTVSISAGTNHVAEGDSTAVPSKTQEANTAGSGSITLGVDGSMSFSVNGRTYQGFVSKDQSAVILISHSEGDKMGIHFCTRDLLEVQD